MPATGNLKEEGAMPRPSVYCYQAQKKQIRLDLADNSRKGCDANGQWIK